MHTFTSQEINLIVLVLYVQTHTTHVRQNVILQFEQSEAESLVLFSFFKAQTSTVLFC